MRNTMQPANPLTASRACAVLAFLALAGAAPAVFAQNAAQNAGNQDNAQGTRGAQMPAYYAAPMSRAAAPTNDDALPGGPQTEQDLEGNDDLSAQSQEQALTDEERMRAVPMNAAQANAHAPAPATDTHMQVAERVARAAGTEGTPADKAAAAVYDTKTPPRDPYRMPW